MQTAFADIRLEPIIMPMSVRYVMDWNVGWGLVSVITIN